MRRYFNRHILTILFMGFSSGLPIGLIGSTLQAWYTISGVSLMTIGWLTMVGQPYAYKFLWAPFLDRWVPMSMDRRRSWIFIMQLALAGMFAWIAFMHPAKTPALLAFIALFAAFFSATQDTAIDAYRTELLTSEEQGLGVSANTVAYRVAMIVASAVALVIAAKVSWCAMYLMMAGCFLSLAFVTRYSPASMISHSSPSTLRDAIIAPMRSFFSRQHAVLILFFIVLYKLPDAMALSLNTTFLIRGVGFDLIQIATISKTVGIVASLVGSVIGGLLMPYLGVYRSLWIFGLLQLSSNLLYAWLAIVGKNIAIMSIAIFGENFCSGLSTVAFIVFLMNLCDRRYTATHYALFSAVASLGRVFIGPISAVTVAHFGWVDFYVVSTLIGFPALLILFYFRENVYNTSAPLPNVLESP